MLTKGSANKFNFADKCICISMRRALLKKYDRI